MQAQPLDRGFNVAVNHIASKLFPCGFDVSENAPETFEALKAHYEETGRILVWNGASDQTIFADSETNYAFRAWHDWRHISEKADFSLDGETKAMQAQQADIRLLYCGETAENYCLLLEAEIIGQALYLERYGGFPLDQIGFAKCFIGNARHPGSTPSPLTRPSPIFGLSKPED